MARRSERVLVAFAVVAWLACPHRAEAQRPICAPTGENEAVVSVCAPFTLIPAIRLMADFTVDQLFKPAPPAFSRNPVDLAQVFSPVPFTEAVSLRQFLAALAPVRFTQLDRTTGTFVADNSSAVLEFESLLSNATGKATLGLVMPRLLRGGYWRGPDVLQMAFWEAGRIRARLTVGNEILGGEIECLSLSPDGLLVRFAPSGARPLLMRFRECNQ